MNITRTYEVWTGGDMIADFISSRDRALKIAHDELLKESETSDPADVVVDEIIHYEMTHTEDYEQLKKEI